MRDRAGTSPEPAGVRRDRRLSAVVVGRTSELGELIVVTARSTEQLNVLPRLPQLEGWFHIAQRPEPNKALLVKGMRRHVQRGTRNSTGLAHGRVLLPKGSAVRCHSINVKDSRNDRRVALVCRAHPRRLPPASEALAGSGAACRLISGASRAFIERHRSATTHP